MALLARPGAPEVPAVAAAEVEEVEVAEEQLEEPRHFLRGAQAPHRAFRPEEEENPHEEEAPEVRHDEQCAPWQN